MTVGACEEIVSPEGRGAESPRASLAVEAAAIARRGGGDPNLALYFNDLAGHPVLTHAQEAEIAYRIQSLEAREWEELLSFPPLLPHLLGRLRACVNGAMPVESRILGRFPRRYRRARGRLPERNQAWLRASAAQMGRKLRDLDCDRLLLDGAIAMVRALPQANGSCPPDLRRVVQTRRYDDYLGRVNGANRTTRRERERFVLSNLRLVVSVARRYHRGRLSLDDLIQEGNIGLMKAVDRYDVRKGYRFSTYASWWIRHAINRALADKGRAIRIPVHMLDTHHRIQRAFAEYAVRRGCEPPESEVAEQIGMDEEKILEVRAQSFDPPLSLDRPLGDDEGRRFVDVLSDDAAPDPFGDMSRSAWRDELARLLDRLPSIEACILRWRFGLDDEDEMTLKEIGDRFNLSRERIRQLQEQALARMRKQMRGPF
jgi:RNA polymerase primary sigma factor